MKISINKIIAQKVNQGEKVFLPRIGILYIKDGRLVFSNKINATYNNSILTELEKAYNVDKDVAYRRYEYWRRAITIKENSFDIIRIESVIWIVIDSNNDFYYYPDSIL